MWHRLTQTLSGVLPQSLSLQKRILQYFVRRIAGPWLQDVPALEQLELHLSEGTVVLTDLTLHLPTVNAYLATQAWGWRLTEGRIGTLKIAIPWSAIWDASCQVTIDAVHLVVVDAATFAATTAAAAAAAAAETDAKRMESTVYASALDVQDHPFFQQTSSSSPSSSPPQQTHNYAPDKFNKEAMLKDLASDLRIDTKRKASVTSTTTSSKRSTPRTASASSLSSSPASLVGDDDDNDKQDSEKPIEEEESVQWLSTLVDRILQSLRCELTSIQIKYADLLTLRVPAVSMRPNAEDWHEKRLTIAPLAFHLGGDRPCLSMTEPIDIAYKDALCDVTVPALQFRLEELDLQTIAKALQNDPSPSSSSSSSPLTTLPNSHRITETANASAWSSSTPSVPSTPPTGRAQAPRKEQPMIRYQVHASLFLLDVYQSPQHRIAFRAEGINRTAEGQIAITSIDLIEHQNEQKAMPWLFFVPKTTQNVHHISEPILERSSEQKDALLSYSAGAAAMEIDEVGQPPPVVPPSAPAMAEEGWHLDLPIAMLCIDDAKLERWSAFALRCAHLLTIQRDGPSTLPPLRVDCHQCHVRFEQTATALILACDLFGLEGWLLAAAEQHELRLASLAITLTEREQTQQDAEPFLTLSAPCSFRLLHQEALATSAVMAGTKRTPSTMWRSSLDQSFLADPATYAYKPPPPAPSPFSTVYRTYETDEQQSPVAATSFERHRFWSSVQKEAAWRLSIGMSTVVLHARLEQDWPLCMRFVHALSDATAAPPEAGAGEQTSSADDMQIEDDLVDPFAAAAGLASTKATTAPARNPEGNQRSLLSTKWSIHSLSCHVVTAPDRDALRFSVEGITLLHVMGYEGTEATYANLVARTLTLQDERLHLDVLRRAPGASFGNGLDKKEDPEREEEEEQQNTLGEAQEGVVVTVHQPVPNGKAHISVTLRHHQCLYDPVSTWHHVLRDLASAADNKTKEEETKKKKGAQQHQWNICLRDVDLLLLESDAGAAGLKIDRMQISSITSVAAMPLTEWAMLLQCGAVYIIPAYTSDLIRMVTLEYVQLNFVLPDEASAVPGKFVVTNRKCVVHLTPNVLATLLDIQQKINDAVATTLSSTSSSSSSLRMKEDTARQMEERPVDDDGPAAGDLSPLAVHDAHFLSDSETSLGASASSVHLEKTDETFEEDAFQLLSDQTPAIKKEEREEEGGTSLAVVEDWFDRPSERDVAEERLMTQTRLAVELNAISFDILLLRHAEDLFMSETKMDMADDDSYLKVECRGLDATYRHFHPETGHCPMVWSLQVLHLEIIDHLASSRWNKFLTAAGDDHLGLRETAAPMLSLELKRLPPSKPPSSPTSAKRYAASHLLHTVMHDLHIKVHPLRLFMDQDAVDLLLRHVAVIDAHRPAQDDIDEKEKKEASNREEELFFRHVRIDKTAMVVDYKPKQVKLQNVKDGNVSELINLFQFDGARVEFAALDLHAIEGWQALGQKAMDEWLPSIVNSQLGTILSSWAPIRTAANLGEGIAQLIRAPIEQYQKDGRIVRGLQKGVKGFAKSTALESIRLGSKIAIGTQNVLSYADRMLNPQPAATAQEQMASHTPLGYEPGGPSSPMAGHHPNTSTARPSLHQRKMSKHAEQPASLREGMLQAFGALSTVASDLRRTSSAASGAQSPNVARALPSVILRPMIGASQAVQKTLEGAKNSISGTERTRMINKYKGAGHSSTPTGQHTPTARRHSSGSTEPY